MFPPSLLACRKRLNGVNQYDVKRVITKATWAEIRTAYASGLGLREMARNMDIPAGTILSRAKREAWPGDALSCFAFQ